LARGRGHYHSPVFPLICLSFCAIAIDMHTSLIEQTFHWFVSTASLFNSVLGLLHSWQAITSLIDVLHSITFVLCQIHWLLKVNTEMILKLIFCPLYSNCCIIYNPITYFYLYARFFCMAVPYGLSVCLSVHHILLTTCQCLKPTIYSALILGQT